MMKKLLISSLTALTLASFAATPGLAESGALGHALPWQTSYIAAATPVNEELHWLSGIVHYIIAGIVAFVLSLMMYIIIRFNRRSNPVPARFSHNTVIEFIWTVVPVVILISIAIPSLRIHYFMEKDVQADMTLKVTGHQWYWSYQYPDQGNIEFDSYIKTDPKDKDHPKPEELQPGELRLLEVDNHVVVPVDTTVRVLITGADVIHSWAIPAFGVKRDGVPGRLNETWFKATKTGVFYGQCSELCGKGHGFMPIAVEVVTKEEFDTWVKKHKQSAASEASGKQVATLP